MPKIAYIEKRFNSTSKVVIEQANAIIDEYRLQGFDLTLRQLYYQFVARDLIPNKFTEYKRIGSIVNDARLAGLIDWDALKDMTRNLRGLQHWSSPTQILDAAIRGYRRNMWETQSEYVEVWIEKDALIGVIEAVCNEFDVSYFSCRGYTSQSEMWNAAQRIESVAAGKHATILHFGDHDPSGMDMTRDIRDRLDLFLPGLVNVTRVALTMDQIDEYDPPPNYAKLTDSRANDYIAEYGDSSWELDALEPAVIANLIRESIEPLRDLPAWNETKSLESEHRSLLGTLRNDLANRIGEA